jgi:hypothetical protein
MGGKYSKKSEKFPAGILLPRNHGNYPEPAASGPGCSTWEINIIKFLENSKQYFLR